MNETVSPAKPAPREHERASSKPLRSERIDDMRKKKVKTGAVAAGGLLALVGIAAVLLGA
jgi:hypothetical protein